MEDKEIKKIIAISSSPSKGRNSDTMLDHFVSGVENYGNDLIEIEKFYLDDIYFDHYDYGNRLGPTEKESDFRELALKMNDAEGIIIATPTYNFSVPASLKNLVDRIRFIALDLEKENILGQPVGNFKKHRFFFLVTGGTPKYAQKILFFLYPAFWLRIVFMYYGSYKMNSYYSGDTKAFENPKILKKCFKLGEKFSKKIL
jgi:multimeric flavodoxin WrbA